ncbi:MAG: hypothetical protein ACRD3V_26330, partial [Vicinamibacteria bacterium]
MGAFDLSPVSWAIGERPPNRRTKTGSRKRIETEFEESQEKSTNWPKSPFAGPFSGLNGRQQDRTFQDFRVNRG